MLILLLEPKEKKNEIIIGDDIVVRLLDIYPEKNQIRIGVEAPKNILIDRRQVRDVRERRVKNVLLKHIIEKKTDGEGYFQREIHRPLL